METLRSFHAWWGYVAIVANDGGLPAGTVFPSGLTLVEKVPQGHKVALVDLAAGEPEGGSESGGFKLKRPLAQEQKKKEWLG